MNKSGFTPRGRQALPKELLQYGVHLVYTEGTKTEPFYIENIKKNIAKKYNCRQNDIQIISASSKVSYNTCNLVKYALKDVKNRLNKQELIHHVWVFFDKDDFSDFDKAHNMILKQNDSKESNSDGFHYNMDTEISWHSCWSNECFELWLCLYFDYYNVPQLRRNYKKHIEKNISKIVDFEYEKNQRNLHDILTENGGSIEAAIKHAKMLNQSNGIGNPSTGVFEFAEYFNPYMK